MGAFPTLQILESTLTMSTCTGQVIPFAYYAKYSAVL